MALTLISNSGKVNYNIKHLVADTAGDLPVTDITPGSIAYVIDEEKNYVLNSTYNWVAVLGDPYLN